MQPAFDLQDEAAECGLACISAICQLHGSTIELAYLRDRFPVSLRGTSLDRLIDIAGALGLVSRAIKIESDDLRDVRAPAVLHWNMEHFLVLLSQNGNGSCVVFDPAVGVKVVSKSEIEDRFTGIVLELSPGENFLVENRKKSPNPLKNYIWRDLRGRLSLLLVLSIFLQVTVFSTPFFFQWVLDEAMGLGNSSIVWQISAGLLGLVVLQSLLHFARGWSTLVLASELGMRWTGHVVDHMLSLPLLYFEKRHLGDLVSRVDAVHTLRRFVTTATVEAVIDGVVAIGAVCLLIWYNKILAMIAVTAVILYWILRFLTSKAIRVATERHVRCDAKQQTYLLETLRGVRSIKLNGRTSQRHTTFQNMLGETIGAETALGQLTLRISTSFHALFGVERTLIIAIGAIAVIDSRLTVGMLVAFLGFRDMFSVRASALADKLAELHALGVHYRRLGELLSAEVESKGDCPLSREDFLGCVELRDVWFRYGEGEPWVLSGCSAIIPAGEAVAITGPSGCGKSTLLKIMLGVLKPSSGQVLVDGRSLETIMRSDFLALIGTVLQEDSLFAGTVADNIAFSSVGYSPECVETAARRSSVHEEIMRMTMGYHTLVGDMGDSLSGGQRQRIMLARALYRRPKILFLDEATSHLDSARERSIAQEISSMNMTRVVVAHRQETILTATRVFLLTGGVLHETKAHPTCS